MTFSLCCCGKTDVVQDDTAEVEDEDDQEEIEDLPEPVADPEPVHYPGAELAKEGVYDAVNIEVDGLSTHTSICSSGKSGDEIWVVTTDYGQNDINNEAVTSLVKIDCDSEKSTTLVLNDNPYNDPEGILEEHSIRFSYIDYYGFGEFDYHDGITECVFYVASYDSKDKRTHSLFDVRWNEKGELIGSTLLPVDVGTYGTCSEFLYTCDDELLVTYDYMSVNENTVRAVLLSADRFDSPTSSIVSLNKDISEWGSYSGSMVAREDGIYILRRSDMYSEDGVVEGKIDPSTLDVTYNGSLSQLGSGSSYCVGCTDEGYLFSHFSGIEYASLEEKGNIILDYVNSDIPTTGVFNIIPIDGLDKIFFITYGVDYDVPSFMICSARDPEEIEECPVITLAYHYPESEIINMIHDFNTSDSGYRIVVKDYGYYEDIDDFEAWKNKLREDAENGRMCDIICLDEIDDLDIRHLADMNLLADIGKLIEDDPGMSLDDYASGVFDAATVDGTLYNIIPYFAIETVFGSSAIMSGCENWTVDEFINMSEEIGADGGKMFDPYVTRDVFLDSVMNLTGSSWVNLDEDICDFTDPSFMKLLGYAMSLPEEIGYDDGSIYDYWDRSYEMFESGEIRLKFTGLSHISTSLLDGYTYFNASPVYTGLPSPSMDGSCITISDSYVLKADSEYLSVCWDFIKPLLQAPYQDDTYLMPVLLSSLEDEINSCDADVSYDYDGESYTGRPTYFFGETECEMPVLSDEEKEKYLEFILSVDSLYFYNEDIITMVKDAVGDGVRQGKTPEEVASSIQVQVQDYLRDN